MTSRIQERYLAYLIRVVLCYTVLFTGAPLTHAQTVNFEFEDADLRAVIKAVAEFTGKNFLVDPAVKGKVTVVAPQPVTEEEAYRTFLSVLEVHGYVAVESEGVIKIVPEEEGKTHEGVPDLDKTVPNRDDMVTRILRLEHVMAERLVPVLRPLVAPYGHLAADAGSDSLIVTDRSANVSRIVEIVRRLDRPANTGEVELLTLKNASAESLARLIEQLYQQTGAENKTISGTVVIADSRTNSLIIKADSTIRKEILAIAVELDQPTGTGGDTHVIYLKNADALNMAEVLQATLDKSGEENGKLSTDVIITADPDTNSLILTASKSDFTTLERVIGQLDIRRLQVYVEALIAEVRTDKGRELGVQWQTADGLRDDRRGVVGRTDFRVGTSITDVILNPLAAGAGLALGYSDGTVTLPDGTEIVNLSVLATALDSQTNVNVLSTPNILTMDNQEAEIIIGQNVPFITGSYSQINQGTAVNNPFQTIVREDVGLTLRIKPQITEGSAIKLEIFQEVSSVAQKGEAFDIVTNTRSLTTTIVAENNRMVVLGGLIQEDASSNEQKVPLLGDIPLLGNLFRYRNTNRVKTNLLIFLRPKIVRGLADMDGPTRKKYEYIDTMSSQQGLRQPDTGPSPFDEWELITPDQESTDTSGGNLGESEQ